MLNVNSIFRVFTNKPSMSLGAGRDGALLAVSLGFCSFGGNLKTNFNKNTSDCVKVVCCRCWQRKGKSL